VTSRKGELSHVNPTTLHSTLFVSLPITENLASDGTFRPERESAYGAVFGELANYDMFVESAALHEDWGRIEISPEEFTRYDFEALQRADALLAVTCTALTRDIYLELGFAAARGLRLLIVVPSRCRITYMITGLVDRGQAIVRRFESESQLAEIVNEEMPKLLPRAIDDRPPLGASGAAKLD
jgi:hypothetical protein